MSGALSGRMRALILLLLLGCRHQPPAATATPVAPASADEVVPTELAWVDEIFPLLQAGDWAGVSARLDAVLARPDLGNAGVAMARWYRAAARANLGDRTGELEDLGAFVSAASQLSLDHAGVAGAELKHRVAMAQLAILAETASTDGSIGATPESAVPVMLASDEYFFLGRLSCGPDLAGSYAVLEQALVQDERGTFDELHVRCLADQTERTIWFDIAEWWALLGYGLQGGDPPVGLDEAGAKYLIERGMQ